MGAMVGSVSLKGLFSMGVNHGLGIASWRVMAALLSGLIVNMGAITLFDFSEDKWIYCTALILLLSIAVILIWRKLQRQSFIDSIMDLEKLLDLEETKESQYVLERECKRCSENLVHVVPSSVGGSCVLDEKFAPVDFRGKAGVRALTLDVLVYHAVSSMPVCKELVEGEVSK